MGEGTTAAEEPELALRVHRSRQRVFDESLVLHAEAIPHRVEADEPVWTLWVRREDLPRAERALLAWRQENRVSIGKLVRHWMGQTPAPVFAAICLFGQLATGPRDERVEWFKRGTADASAILHGEWWRCITALTLHADLSHALGNAVCGFVIIDALGRKLGPAWAAWLTLLSGIAGNFLTAWVVRENHFSIGASTSVFGALGALTAAQFISRERRGFITIGAGVALLAFLGSGKNADLFAHLFGALAGFLLGLAAGFFQRESPKEKALQPLLAIAALLPVGAAWWRALQ